MRLVVIGGGISGLATAFRIREAFQARGQPLELHVLEAADRVGGKIRTECVEGYRLEWGPNGFLDNKPDTLALCRDLGIEGALLPASEAAARRYVYSKGMLHPVPETPLAFFRSPLLTRRGRIRVLAELWAPKTPPGLDTSIAEFGTRRLGREALEKLLDPMVSGIFAGDPAVMSLSSCFPRIAELEEVHGSLIRAMIVLRRQKRRGEGSPGGETTGRPAPGDSTGGGGPAGPGGRLTSLEQGMEQLVKALEERLGRCVRKQARVTSMVPAGNGGRGGGYRVRLLLPEGQGEILADAVVIAVPAYEARVILEGMDPGLSALLDGIPYAPLVVVGLGFPGDQSPGPLEGFGFLVPYQEGSPVLGSLWTSSIFTGRAPEGFVLTRNMIGGYRNGWVSALGDEELVEIAAGMLERAAGARGTAVFRRCVRHPKAIPLYLIGHESRLKRLEQGLERFPGVYLTGNAYRGIGLNDCAREAVRAAARVAEDLVQGRIPGRVGRA